PVRQHSRAGPASHTMPLHKTAGHGLKRDACRTSVRCRQTATEKSGLRRGDRRNLLSADHDGTFGRITMRSCSVKTMASLAGIVAIALTTSTATAGEGNGAPPGPHYN